MKAFWTAILIAAFLAPGSAYAGWGAIAYNPVSGVSAEIHGQPHVTTAMNGALKACGHGCLIVNWEKNLCIAFATDGRGSWGSSGGYASSNLATANAIAACAQAGCAWRVWACS
jgi:Domain of unknown function (DUF4189)